jgi:dTDP-4-amino-4,6-dideoxygalactose transaminase
MAWAAQRGVRVVEDAAQAPGAVVQGKKAGTWGDAGVLSFGGSKLLTAGRGGALLTRHADVAQRARVWLHRGNHICPLSELQAAVLLPQLDKLDTRTARRADRIRLLVEHLRDVPGLVPFTSRDAHNQPAYYKLGLQYDSSVFGLPREVLINAARAEGVALDAGFPSLHRGRSPSRLRKVGALPHSDRAHDDALVLHHPVLLEEDVAIREVVEALQKIHAHAGRLRDATRGD